MKSLFSTIKNNLCFDYAQRLAMVCLFVVITFSTAFANSWSGYAKAEAKFATSTSVKVGQGKVYVGKGSNPTPNYTSDKNGSSAKDDKYSDEEKKFTFTWFASVEEGTNSAFDGWYKELDASGEQYKSSIQFSEDITVSADDETSEGNPKTVTYYALFRKVIDAPTEVSFTKTTQEMNETFDVNLFSATNFRVKSVKHEKGESRIFTATLKEESLTDNKATVSISAGNDLQNGDVFVVTLTTDNGGDVEVKVKIISKISVTFNLPERGRGYYEAIQTNNGNAVTYNSQCGESKGIDLTDTKQFFQRLQAYPAVGYRFYRWIVKDKDDNITYSTTNPLSLNLNNGDEISVEFLPEGIAQFMVKGVPWVYYYELDAAIEAAKKAISKTVVVYSSGKLYTEYKDPVDGKYEFIIPSGVTLLVPGDDSHNMSVILDENYVVGTSPGTSVNPFCTLTLPSNVHIIANGNICVFATVTYYHGANGTPINPGIIHMEDGAKITINGNLTAFGYITGNYDSETGNYGSEVVVNSGAKVYELFQFRDWRGGSVSSQMEEVFPLSQYYIQNIETKMTINSGATLYGSSVISVTLFGAIPANVKLVASTANDNKEGLFILSDGVKLIKWYNSKSDRQMYLMQGTSDEANVKIGEVHLSFSGSLNVNSKNYILPITNNLDITFDNVDITSTYDFSILPGANITLKNNSTFTSSSNIYVHDAEFLTTVEGSGFCYVGNGGNNGAKDYEYMPVWYTPTKDHNICLQRTRPLDATIDIQDGCSWIVSDGGLYTTGAAQPGNEYGANIISTTGGGIVKFNKKGQSRNQNLGFYQINPKETYASVPVTNARLRNGNGTWSAGEYATEGDEYIYSSNRNKWVTPREGISFGAVGNNVFSVCLPTEDQKTQNVEIGVITNDALTISDFVITCSENQYFKLKEGGAASYVGGENKKLIIPITYTLTKVHNKDVNPNTYTGNITVSCPYTTSDGEDVNETINVALSAIEDYTPEFTVTINGLSQSSGSEYDFGETKALLSVERDMVITPTTGTVAELETTEWSIEPTGLFSAIETSVTYKPQVQTTGESDEGTLTITATYKDKDNNSIFKSITINLKGKAILQEPALAFRDDLPIEIYQAENITDIFGNLGSGENVAFTYTYSDGTPADGLLVATKEENGNYTLIAETTDYVDNRVVTVTAIQSASDVMNGATRTVTITIKPVVAWNWSTLYFGTERDNPVTVARDGDWSLIEFSDGDELVSLSGTSPNYSATIDDGTDAEQVYTATFKFVQGGYEKVFTSNIYADPRILDLCVDYEREFKDVSTQNVTTVTFDESTKNITFRPQDKWEINMIGTPDKLTFTASGDGQWYIGERANASINYSDVVAWSKVSGTQTIQLKPTTNQVIIQYGASDNNGTIANLCISELSLSADKDVVYFPINKDGSNASKTIVLTHASAVKPIVQIDSKFTIPEFEPQPVGPQEDPYYQTTIKIEGSKSMVDKGEYELIVTQAGDEIRIPIYVDEFPQGLPIKLKDDDAKRYHFIAVETDKVVWDGENKKVVFQMPEGAQKTRSVTFAFEGAPSRVSFTSSQVIVDNQWRIEESVDGTPDSYEVSGLANRDTESGSNFVHNLKYTTRYLRIVYTSDNTSEVALSNFVIEGDPMLLVNPEELEFSTEDEEKTKMLTLTAINLENIKVELDNTTDFKMSHGSEKVASYYELTPEDYPEALGVNKVGNIEINTEWITNSIVNDGIITIYNMGDIDNTDDDYVLAKVKLVGAGKYLKLANAEKTGIYTGIPNGSVDVNKNYTYHGNAYSDYTYHEVDLRNAFSADGTGTALFDYLFVYGETTPSSGNNITAPEGDNGSNARTPCYVYIRDKDVNGNFDRYRFVTMLDNVNVGDKDVISTIIKSSSETSVDGEGKPLEAVDVKYIDVSSELSVYITGFAPYATTGYTKADEGVFLFRGKSGAKLHVYLENAYIFARNKMKDGQPFYTRGDERNPTFSEKYARGSGGVLVFECVDQSENIITMPPFEVTIHTIGRNLLKSNYGCFNFFFGMDPFQISAPIHVRLHSAAHEHTSKTVLNFTDEWPTKLGVNRVIETSKRTNGFLSLQKQSNNAPSIDLGNPHTVVNFLGGQVELQNAQIVSTNYKTTLAISYRSGEYGSDNLGLKFASGIGTDAVDGTVNFYDGTVTILPMWVKEEYKNYYLIDKDADGNEIKRKVGVKEMGNNQYIDIYEYQTTCLRTPKNTNVYGGSICWLRACQHVTSKGGAPSDGAGHLLGQYIYEFGGDDTKNSETGLVTNIDFPANVKGLLSHYDMYHPKKTYGIESVMPDKDNKLYFWIPEGYGGVTPEKDKILTTWKACMTEISAGLQGQTGSVGGNTSIEQNEEVKYLLYCKIDENIHGVISKGEGSGDDKTYSYKAPVEVPPVALEYFEGRPYTEISPSFVGGSTEHEVLSDISYTVTDKVYYVTTATADIWKTFTAPFDVAKIWVVETFEEAELVTKGNRSNILLEQAKHNADFAAFFGVAMAIGTTNSFDQIYQSYLRWAKIQDGEENNNAYTKRGRYELTPYINLTAGGTNWNSANFYINENDGNWGLTDNPEIFDVNWKTLNESDLNDGILMHKGETYSLLFPYCVGCWDYDDESNHLLERTEWDYWSGKFLIFESPNAPQTIDGRNFLNDDDLPETNDIFNNKPNEGVMVTGNSTFSFLETNRSDVYSYVSEPNDEYFASNSYYLQDLIILPTESFLYGQVPTNANGASVLSISRTGQIKYRPTSEGNGNGNDTTDTHVPTINGDCDIFVTSTAEGIRVAVEEPQYVGVFAAAGQLIYNGWVETSVDVALVNRSVYVVVGENNSVKVVY